MITKIRVISTPDIYVGNKVMSFSQETQKQNTGLAAASWLIDSAQARDSMRSVLQFAYNMIARELPQYKVWLLIGTSAWQPDTRVVRYRKLWGALEARGIKISNMGDSLEHIFEAHGKIKFFGAIQFFELSVEAVVKAILEEHCAYVVALPGNYVPKDAVAMGWVGDLQDDFKFIDHLSKSGAVVFKKVGEFDDPECGLVGIGKPELIKVLTSNTQHGLGPCNKR